MPVFLLLLIALITIPVAELYVLIEIGGEIGAPATISLVIITAVLGAWLLRWQGLATLARAQQSMNAGELPALEMLEGLILLLTGVMLLTPGFITDGVGFLCLIPGVRRLLAGSLASKLIVRAEQRGRPGANSSSGAHTLDGDFTVEPDANDPDRHRLP